MLEGLLEYERAGRKAGRKLAAVTKARKQGRKLSARAPHVPLASHRRGHQQTLAALLVSRCIWHYDVLRGLDYLRNAGIKPDSRVDEAIEVVMERRHQNGRWPLNLLHPEHIPLEMETDVGRASRWNTLRALRVLRWYNDATR